MEKVFRDWSVMDVLDLRKALARNQTFEAIAIVLKRDVEDVREKAVTLGLWGQKIPLHCHRKRTA